MPAQSSPDYHCGGSRAATVVIRTALGWHSSAEALSWLKGLAPHEQANGRCLDADRWLCNRHELPAMRPGVRGLGGDGRYRCGVERAYAIRQRCRREG